MTSALADLSSDFVALLACCHALTYVGPVLSGDPLELKTFNFTEATLTEPHTHETTSHFQADSHFSDADAAYVSKVTVPAAAAEPTPAARPFARPSGPNGIISAVVTLQFEFMPALQRMGVLVGIGNRTMSYVKGSPEAVMALVSAGSFGASIPPDFDSILGEYTHKGYRVLAAAARDVTNTPLANWASTGKPVEQLRVEAERDLTFLGFIVLENKLKPQTMPTLAKLRNEGQILLHMVTGDNPVSAVCVARDAGLVLPGHRVFIGDLDSSSAPVTSSTGSAAFASRPRVFWSDVDNPSSQLDPNTLLPLDGSASHPYTLALTGRAFSHLLSAHRAPAATPAELDFLPRALLNCSVLARMSPENKAQVVEVLQSTGLYVGMCGDGANDSLALRAAHVGISLSQVEASVSAPFTSMVADISCVPKVLCEGRGALATSFCLFDFMALYSTIQFANALLCVTMQSFLSNNQFLYQDLFIVFILALFLGKTPASPTLTKKRPSSNLLSIYNMLICFGFIGLTFAMQGMVFGLVKQESW
jgi:cation-transporting ATPase 13A3/4/5